MVLHPVLPIIQVKFSDSDRLSLSEIGKVVPANRSSEAVRTIHERRSLGGEVVAKAEQQSEVGLIRLLE